MEVSRQGKYRMSRKTLAAVVATNAAATAVAAYSLGSGWPAALAAGIFSALLVRLALALTLEPQPAARRNDPRRRRFRANGAGLHH
jgi:hypothetical protein